MTVDTRTTSTQDLLERRARAVPRGPFHVAPFFVSRAEGAKLWDTEGREYIDFSTGISVLNVGHNHPRVVEAIRAQSARYVHTCWHVVMYEEYLELAERLNDLAPTGVQNKTVFFNSGAEAAENAVKISRAATGRQAAVTFERGFHGRTLLAMTLTGKVHPYTAGFGPFAPEVYHLPWEPFFGRDERSEAAIERDCRAAIDHLFAYHIEPEAIACLLVEPVLGEGGFLPIHPVALRLLRQVTREHGIVLVADEVQSGCGRCGALFAVERYAVEPDLVLMAKSLAGGLPLSAVSGKAALLDAPEIGGIGGTFGGNPVACAAALAVLDVLEEEGLYERAQRIGERVLEVFATLERELDFVVDARGLGAMCGLEIGDPETGVPDPARAGRIVQEAIRGGLLVMTASGNVIRTLMPLNIPDDELERGLEILDQAVRKTAR